MFDIQAALLRSQFEKLERFYERRTALKKRIDAALSDVPEITLPAQRSWVKHAYHLYTMILRIEMLTADRDTIMNAIQAENIGIGIHFRAVHLHPYYADTFGFARGMCPHAEYYSDRTISLPLYPKMTDADADDVATAVRKVISHYRR
jgi:dTDP-4-amino-4,6-dideoxygalactose transaminase